MEINKSNEVVQDLTKQLEDRSKTIQMIDTEIVDLICSVCNRKTRNKQSYRGNACGLLCSGTLIHDFTAVINKIPLQAVKSDPVNHPPHYKSHPSGIECIEITEHMNFNIGNAIKYLWRASDKGKTIEDYQKAVWYINREIARLQKET